ncbi:MAG TPA: hypothetical protein VFD57_05690 [Clostridia bacterium]|nr:hypothetical protein [Clostridia bacterium]
MAKKEDLGLWILEALRANNGQATLLEICKYVWQNYENELRTSGDLFYTWQYEIRWQATYLRKEGLMKDANLSPKGVWEIA